MNCFLRKNFPHKMFLHYEKFLKIFPQNSLFNLTQFMKLYIEISE